MNRRIQDTGIRRQYKKILSIGIMLMLSAAAFAQKFSAVASVKDVPQNSTFEIVYTIENGGEIKFIPPKFDGFDAYGPSTSQSSALINGKYYQKASFIYTLQPKKQGSFILPAASANVDGKLIKSNTVPINVTAPVKQQQAPAGAGNGSQYADPYAESDKEDNDIAQLNAQIAKNFFVAVVPDKYTLYEGDQLTLTYKIYNTNVQFRNLVAVNDPSFDGFLTEELESDPKAKASVDVYKGNKYLSKVLRRVALFPVKSGKYQIEPVKLNAVIYVNVPDPFFGGYNIEPYSYDFQSNALQLEVLPLPKPQPANFSGAVGNFTFAVKYDKSKVKVNEPLTLKVTYSGTGNIKLIQAPKLEFPEAFEVYPPKVKETYATEGSGVSGVKSFEYVFVPQDGGKFTLPSYEFAYFDPAQKKYVTFTLPETTIDVEGKAAPSANLKRLRARDKDVAKQQDIYGIAVHDGHPGLLYGTPVFWGLGAAPIGLLLLGFLFRRRNYGEGELLVLRRRKATRMAMKRLATAKKLMQPSNEKAFYNEVIRALWQYVSDKLYINTSELSRENIEQQLLGRDVSVDRISGLIAMLDTCEMALFSQQGRAEQMRETYQAAVQWITETDEQLTQEKA